MFIKGGRQTHLSLLFGCFEILQGECRSGGISDIDFRQLFLPLRFTSFALIAILPINFVRRLDYRRDSSTISAQKLPLGLFNATFC